VKSRLVIVVFMILTVWVAGCVPASNETATQPPSQPSETIYATLPPTTVTQPTGTALPTQAPGGTPGELTLDYAAVAQSIDLQTIPAQPSNPGDPYWVGAPEYRLLSLQGYSVTNGEGLPQVFIYPVAEMASANPNMAEVAADLQTLLQTHMASQPLPMLPLPVSEKQIIDARVQRLDFQNGLGVRYLTQTGNGIVPVNNAELNYTFQGLTNDGQYYVAALLPVTHPQLPAGHELGAQLAAEIEKDPGYYANYLSTTITMLEQQPAASFTPNLDSLDAMLRSLLVPPSASATPTPEIFIPAPVEGVLADHTRQDLASRLGMDFTSISVEAISHQDWPDSCLGLAPQGGQACDKTDTPGWRIVLNAAGHTHEYRATEDGSLVTYSGPVTVSGPESCMIDGTSLVYSPEDGYCFAYPIRFHRTDERGPIAVYGPAYGSGPEPLFAALTVEISLLPDGQNLDGAVDDFLAGLGDVPSPQTRQQVVVGGQAGLMLEVVPGMLGSRDVFVVHNRQLFQLTFWPAPSVASDTAVDVEDLYRTVLNSWSFQG